MTDTSSGKIGVIVSNLGTPDGTDYWSMRRYLNEFLSDRRVINISPWKWQPLLQAVILTTRPSRSGAAYREVWNTDLDEGPLATITREQTQALRTALGPDIPVEYAMRYGNPPIKDVLAKMVASGCDRVLFFPLYPQYAGATTATANDHFFRALMDEVHQPAARTVPAYFAHPLYIDALAKSVKAALKDVTPDLVIASYHGMPESYRAAGDPYYDQCLATTDLLQARLGWPDGKLVSTFQSRFGRAEWLQPYTVDEVARLARSGTKNIAMLAPAFSADCLETLEEINGEIREAFLQAGGETFTYIPCLNSDQAHITALAAIIQENLAGWAL